AESRASPPRAATPGGGGGEKTSGATADVTPPVRELESIYDDRSKKRRVTGPVEYAIDGKDETAWGLDVGPGRSNVPRKAVFAFEEPLSFPQGAVPTFKATMTQGAWKRADDHKQTRGHVTTSLAEERDHVP